ncbi:hypothetical protein M422DRAFT_38527 [Sphaerobolus stellatus SS14]|uniref:Uncharacterized protein n=1 Tax=Sphaerobolus stellatus (strain SS14) TaxID=990650 RepID=A0A0C9TV16_SPHS4|nr:hypothetical protein M422DRAFT_38527 [Sphaerobolus stellatus SS14]
MPVATYPCDVKSIAEQFPDVIANPLTPIHLHDGLKASKAKGEPIDIDAVRQAEATAKDLETARFLNGLQITETAKNRAITLRCIHANIAFGSDLGSNGVALEQLQQTLQQALAPMKQDLAAVKVDVHGIKEQLMVTEANVANTKILAHNRTKVSGNLALLQKWIPGKGTTLAMNLLPGNTRGPQNALTQMANAMPEPQVGTVPVIDHSITDLSMDEINKLIVFYNVDFGIKKPDDLETRRAMIEGFFRDYHRVTI